MRVCSLGWVCHEVSFMRVGFLVGLICQDNDDDNDNDLVEDNDQDNDNNNDMDE